MPMVLFSHLYSGRWLKTTVKKFKIPLKEAFIKKIGAAIEIVNNVEYFGLY
jgi:hypothetical protein